MGREAEEEKGSLFVQGGGGGGQVTWKVRGDSQGFPDVHCAASAYANICSHPAGNGKEEEG